MHPSENELIHQHAPMVRRIALQLASRLPSSIELDDLIQAGMMGLLDAVRRYQETPDAQFETYATTRVRGAMLDELRSQDWLPRSVRSKSRQIEQAIHKESQRLLRPPTEKELAQAMGLALADYHQLLEEARGAQVVHYEDLIHAADEAAAQAGEITRQGNDVAAVMANDNPLNALVSAGLRSALMQAIAQLPEREKLLLSLQFEQDLNQKEIAAVLGVTEGRVSQLRTQAIARIRAAMAQQQWDTDTSDGLQGGLW